MIRVQCDRCGKVLDEDEKDISMEARMTGDGDIAVDYEGNFCAECWRDFVIPGFKMVNPEWDVPVFAEMFPEVEQPEQPAP